MLVSFTNSVRETRAQRQALDLFRFRVKTKVNFHRKVCKGCWIMRKDFVELFECDGGAV